MPILNPQKLTVSNPAPTSPSNILVPNLRRLVKSPVSFARDIENVLAQIIAWLGAVHDDSPDSSQDELCPAATGAAVNTGTVLYFANGFCGAASAADVTKIAKASCTEVLTVLGATQCRYVHAGNVVAKIATGQTSLTRGQSLFLSARQAGSLTGNAEETEALYHQECGVFISYVNTTLANVYLRIAPVAGLPG